MQIGGFNEIANPLADEVEFGLRVALTGHKIVQADNCSWSHIHDISNDPHQPIKYLGNYINVRQRQLEIEPYFKSLQSQYNKKL